jgi:hypothetical protein
MTCLVSMQLGSLRPSLSMSELRAFPQPDFSVFRLKAAGEP